MRAELPGTSTDDVTVEVIDNHLVIEGKRKTEKEEDGDYNSECSYGSIRRCLALPYGVNADEATVRFSNGVLEVTMPVSQHRETDGRRLDIKMSRKAIQKGFGQAGAGEIRPSVPSIGRLLDMAHRRRRCRW